MMKSLLYTMTVALACMTAIPVAVVGSSLSSRAAAAEQPCAATVTAESSGASIREDVDAIVQCNTSRPVSTQSAERMTQPHRISADKQPLPTTSPAVKQSNPQPSYCPAVPNLDSSGLFYYFEAIRGCQYGS
jgi:hypothetical protein